MKGKKKVEDVLQGSEGEKVDEDDGYQVHSDESADIMCIFL